MQIAWDAQSKTLCLFIYLFFYNFLTSFVSVTTLSLDACDNIDEQNDSCGWLLFFVWQLFGFQILSIHSGIYYVFFFFYFCSDQNKILKKKYALKTLICLIFHPLVLYVFFSLFIVLLQILSLNSVYFKVDHKHWNTILNKEKQLKLI